MRRRISAVLLTLCMLMSLVPTVAFAAPNGTFDDVNDHWGKNAIERWAGYGVVNGDGSGSFAPDKQMTRAEFATMLANMLGYKEKAANTFADVNDSDWFADAILKLAAAGVMQGSNGMANPNAPISRQEAAVMMCRAFNIPTTGGNLNFADSADVADWAKGAVAALAARGMMNGVGGNNVAPLAEINRASVATLLDNMITEYVTEDKTITGEVSGIVLVAAGANVTLEDATLNENLIVAPKADGAEVTLTGTTTAGDVVVGATATVKVDSTASAGTVQVEAANSTVEVAGKADAVTVDTAANNTAVNVTESAAVGDVAVNAADTKVSVAENATVSNVAVSGSNANVEVSGKVDNVTVSAGATGTDITANSGATVGKVETSANDVTVSGSGKVENVTANDGTVAVTTPGTNVENKTDSADNVTNNGKPVEPSTGGDTPTPTPPSSSGGSSGGSSNPPATTYTITVADGITNGTITTSVSSAAEGTTVTVTGAPNATYALKTVTVTPVTPPAAEDDGEEEAVAGLADTPITVTPAGDNKFTFTMPASNVTVSGEFAQPLTNFKVVVVKDATTYKQLPQSFIDWEKQNGAPSDGNGWSNLSEYPWLAIVAEPNGGITETTDRSGSLDIKFNGTSVTRPTNWAGNVIGGHGALTAYVNTAPGYDPAGDDADQLKVANDAGVFTVTLVYQGATYTGTASYTKPGVTAYEVTFDTNGGSAVDKQNVVSGQKATKPATNPTKEGYTFLKWVTEQDGNTEYNFSTATVTQATTIYAKWEPISYKVKINTNAGSDTVTGDTTDVSATYGTAVTMPSLTRTGYTLKGWAKTADATTVLASADLKNLTTTKDGVVTLYAIWEKVEEATLSAATFENADASVLALYGSGGANWEGAPTNISDIQNGNLTFTPSGTGDAITVNVAGTLKYYETFAAMGNEGGVDRTKGHYMVFKVELPEGAATGNVDIITCNPGAEAGKSWTYKASEMDTIGNKTYWTSIVFIPDGSNPAPSLSYKIDWDGDSGKKFSPVTYTFTFDGLTLSPQEGASSKE